jgi:GNAT superfamily N-acetyltransferase
MPPFRIAPGSGEPGFTERSVAPCFTVAAEAVDSADAVGLLRAYFTELASRHTGRDATDAEVDAAQAEKPSADLAPPTGTFLILRDGSQPVGCAGVRVLSTEIVELTRLFVLPVARGRGAGSQLLAAAEQTGRELGALAMRLDTRSDLVEARALYASSGYVEIPAYSAVPYADHWFEKDLTAPGERPSAC